MKRLFVGGSILLALSFAGGTASALVLAPGATNVIADPTVMFGGTALATTSGNISAPTFTASFTESVYRDPGNVFAPGGNNLDFVYQFKALTGDALESLTSGSFAGFLVNAGFTAVLNDVAPITMSRSSTGSTVSFSFRGTNDVVPGQSSDFLVIQTNATNYTSGFVSLQDDTAGNGVGFVPVSAVPEPSAWMLILGAVGTIGISLRTSARRRRRGAGELLLS